MNKKIIAFFLIVIDWLSAMTSWGLFYYFRKTAIENEVFRVNESFYLGLIFVPILWIFLYYLQGTYHDVRRLYRMKISG